MMKKILLFVAAMIATTASFAQSHNVVTLTHEGNVQAFYGLSALPTLLPQQITATM